MPAQEELKLFSACQADLGESPVWDEAHQCLLFVDISGGQINALDQHGRLTRLYESPARIGALALTDKGNLIFTQDAGVAVLDRTSLRVTHNSKLAITLSSYRFNDGACDPQGRFITGLMDEGHSRNTGKLYRYDAGLNASVIMDGISLPNGLAWSSDGSELFFVDSVARTLYRARYPANGNGLEQVLVFAQTPAELGRPDGLALDVEGNLWVCQFNGSCVLQYDRHGVLLQALPMPVPRPTSCCFGGPDMRTLYITTAKFGMSAAEQADYPAAGNIYSIRLPVPGRPRHRFKEL
ncbi:MULTISPECIES: SMP-30/gluconolactonase/LRE family protein [Pseudomonas]|jgi:sugar lactone lactonase YvrE|uniref:SMP-30/gluconolactonase/LRE family protein n=1 Tax=Pseudomonas rhodesiae TaxID=76760 RepID=A0A8I1JHJ3_9PSED|nr:MULTISPECIES: SMP-30/gluconolactonase/LRE family protein [Pseudomonas]MBB4816619.1 sugar lactone lactonase YvrE [Pseudomonas rhodesiae]MBI6605563.1 SMP-30/gluconolactonase/LRE family protein [Pseudomonas sp. S4_EA_1b]MBI6627485.1 SMP-30/gluconolactonase/LRE family protein [Pseudomonas rhodesiae]MBX4135416.1 SMP-30/gluconolactonase/LRE family protein [Pseudomonas sp. S5F11]MDN6865477.1 SMP-30/gluconolactonase/LRE family protein [Pseudomonas rhodesiae]